MALTADHDWLHSSSCYTHGLLGPPRPCSCMYTLYRVAWLCCFCRSCQTTRGAPRWWSCRQGRTGMAPAGDFAKLAGSSAMAAMAVAATFGTIDAAGRAQNALLITSPCQSAVWVPDSSLLRMVKVNVTSAQVSIVVQWCLPYAIVLLYLGQGS